MGGTNTKPVQQQQQQPTCNYDQVCGIFDNKWFGCSPTDCTSAAAPPSPQGKAAPFSGAAPAPAARRASQRAFPAAPSQDASRTVVTALSVPLPRDLVAFRRGTVKVQDVEARISTIRDPMGDGRLQLLGKGAAGSVYRVNINGLDLALKFMPNRATGEQSVNKGEEFATRLTSGFIQQQLLVTRLGSSNMRVIVFYECAGTLEQAVRGMQAARNAARGLRPARNAGRQQRAGGEQLQLPVDQALPLMAECISALHAVHKKGFAHNDIKSENVFVSKVSRGVRVCWCIPVLV